MPEFVALDALVGQTARIAPDRVAVIDGERTLTYGEFDELIDRVAAAMQADGLKPRDVISICAVSSLEYAATFLGALRAGVAVAPLAPSSTPHDFAAMVKDANAKILFMDEATAAAMGPAADAPLRVSLEDGGWGRPFTEWRGAPGMRPKSVSIDPDWTFNIIYSSGTTGTPKGIVHSHHLRWRQYGQLDPLGYGPDAVTVLSTPLYSNTTLVCFNPTLAGGGTVVLMKKFDARGFLELSERHRATHTMLVPVQYRRIMALPDFDRFDLSSYRMKFCTSAPFAANLKADILKRWPGGLTEYYGMTEGGGSCVLLAHEHPDKLHTVGQPMPEHEVRLIDDNGRPVKPGEIGEIVGHSPVIMKGYLNQPEKTRRYRQAFCPHRRRRPLRRGRLPHLDGPQEGHDHLRRLQHLSERPRGRAGEARRRARSCGGGDALGGVGRNSRGLRGAQGGCRDRCRRIESLDQQPRRQDPAPLRARAGRHPAPQRHRQGAEAGVEGPEVGGKSTAYGA